MPTISTCRMCCIFASSAVSAASLQSWEKRSDNNAALLLVIRFRLRWQISRFFLVEQKVVEKDLSQLQRTAPHFYCARYADNHPLIVDQRWMHLSCLRSRCSDLFYGSPVELEAVAAIDAEQEFLGFDAQVQRASIFVLLRDEPWKVRLSNSAGVRAQKFAAFFSKKYNILRHTWPPEARAQQLWNLQSAGCPREDLS